MRLNGRFTIASRVDTEQHALLAFQGDGRVNGDPVQPGEEQRVSLEAIQVLVGVQKSILDHVKGIFGVFNDSVHRMVKTILIPLHQHAKRGGATLQALHDKAVIVAAHGTLHLLDAFRGKKFRKKSGRVEGTAEPARGALAKIGPRQACSWRTAGRTPDSHIATHTVSCQIEPLLSKAIKDIEQEGGAV